MQNLNSLLEKQEMEHIGGNGAVIPNPNVGGGGNQVPIRNNNDRRNMMNMNQGKYNLLIPYTRSYFNCNFILFFVVGINNQVS